MNKLILTIACLLSFLGQARAQETPINQLYIEPFVVKANGTVNVDVMLNNPDFEGHSFQFRLYVPDGLRIEEGEDEGETYYLFAVTNRISGKFGNRTWEFDVQLEPGTDELGSYYLFKCVDVYNNSTQQYRGIQGTEGSLMTITLKASDQISTGVLNVAIRKQVISDATGDHGIRPDDYEVNATGQIDVTVSDAGYATFSWPRTLDFSKTGLKVYRAAVLEELDKDTEQMTTALIEDGIVAAYEGVLLKGSAGKYNPTTTDETPTPADNYFKGTADAEVIPTAEQHYYVFAQKQNGNTGFYKVQTGVTIPQYKAYLNLDGDYSRITFDLAEEATGIRDLQNGSTDELYDLRGVKLNSQKQRKGVFIQNGKKVVIK